MLDTFNVKFMLPNVVVNHLIDVTLTLDVIFILIDVVIFLVNVDDISFIRTTRFLI